MTLTLKIEIPKYNKLFRNSNSPTVHHLKRLGVNLAIFCTDLSNLLRGLTPSQTPTQNKVVVNKKTCLPYGYDNYTDAIDFAWSLNLELELTSYHLSILSVSSISFFPFFSNLFVKVARALWELWKIWKIWDFLGPFGNFRLELWGWNRKVPLHPKFQPKVCYCS